MIDDGVDLAHALIAYGLDFLKKRKFRKVQTPYMMQKEIMGKTAQLEEFDENLYKVIRRVDVHTGGKIDTEAPITSLPTALRRRSGRQIPDRNL